MRLRCPVCHAEAALEAWAEDEAAREMMGLLSGLEATLGRALVAYLGLWRSPSRALAWERALRLRHAFRALAAHATRWPAPAQLWEHLPPRPEPLRLDPPPPTPQERERIRAMLQQVRQKLVSS